MIRLTELKLPLDHSPEDLNTMADKALAVTSAEVKYRQVFKRSYDARKAQLQVVYIVDVELADPQKEKALLAQHATNPHISATPDMGYKAVARAPNNLRLRPVVVGFGPCGIFAALLLAQMGFKPIVLERGKTVRQRTKDTWGLWRKNQLNPESNVQFGEGGAGTFSDGKLWSQIKDPRYLGRKVMQEFVKAGAPEDILIESHPHIGTFKLVKVVENMREQIIALGGEIRFEQLVTDVLLEDCTADLQGRKGNFARSPCWTSPPIHLMSCLLTMWCSRWAIVRATRSRCCMTAASTWRQSPSQSAFASSTRKA